MATGASSSSAAGGTQHVADVPGRQCFERLNGLRGEGRPNRSVRDQGHWRGRCRPGRRPLGRKPGNVYASSRRRRSDAFIRVDSCNERTTYECIGSLTLTKTLQRLAKVTELIPIVPSAACARFLKTTARHRNWASDSRFVSLAREMGWALVAEDLKLRAAIADSTRSIDEALSRGNRGISQPRSPATNSTKIRVLLTAPSQWSVRT